MSSNFLWLENTIRVRQIDQIVVEKLCLNIYVLSGYELHEY
jgi:hypothetical protein